MPGLSLVSQGTTDVYTGFIKVQMDLRRPVTVRGGQKGAEGEAFYLPRGAINTLHISSINTVKQVSSRTQTRANTLKSTSVTSLRMS